MTAGSTAWAWNQVLTPVSKLVLLALADMAGGNSYTVALELSVDELVTKTRLERRTVQRHLRQLEASHHIVREDRVTSYGARKANLWHLNVNELAPVALDIYGPKP